MGLRLHLLGQRHKSRVSLGSPWPHRRHRNLPQVIGIRYLTHRIPIWLPREGIHFNTLQGRRWINDAFQKRIEEIEGELRTTDALARMSLTDRGRVRSIVPEPLANCLGPEASVTAPAVPSAAVRERLGTVSPPLRQSLESRLGRPNETSSQTSMSVSNLPMLQREIHRQMLYQQRELSQPACCSGTVQILARGGNTRLTC